MHRSAVPCWGLCWVDLYCYLSWASLKCWQAFHIISVFWMDITALSVHIKNMSLCSVNYNHEIGSMKRILLRHCLAFCIIIFSILVSRAEQRIGLISSTQSRTNARLWLRISLYFAFSLFFFLENKKSAQQWLHKKKINTVVSTVLLGFNFFPTTKNITESAFQCIIFSI